MSAEGPGRDDVRRALAAWVGYLREIGVRELIPGTSRTDSQEPAVTRKEAPPPAQAPPRASASPTSDASRRHTARAAPASAELFTLDRDEGGDASNPAERLREIREAMGECTRCRLHAGRRQIVFGTGNPRARLMFVGEGPGADEDAQGEPFVGRAGQLLNKMIVSIGLERPDVYIANVVKCRPPENRTPEADETATCSPFLFAQIEAIRPRVIVALGAPAAKTLLGTRLGITQIRGTWGSFRGIPVMPTFHPAYLLRAYTPENRRKVWEDLKAARARMDEEP